MKLSSGVPVVRPNLSERKPASKITDLYAAFATGNTRATAQAILDILESIAKDPAIGHEPKDRAMLARKMDAALDVFVDPAFEVPDDLWEHFIRFNPLIANVMASVGTTTDHRIRQVIGQKQEPYKSTVLFSPRNQDIAIDFRMMLDSNPLVSSEWFYWTAKTLYQGNADKRVVANFLSLIDQANESLIPTHMCHEVYFLCSYLGSIEHERKIKGLINAGIQRSVNVVIRNNPNPRKIAVWADYWSKGHSVYRSLNAYVQALRQHFDEITLIHAIKKTEELVTDGFDKVIRLTAKGIQIDPSPLQDNEWSAVIFADVGMTAPSVLLSNLRIAPVQILLTGHPVSTFGGQMDWFVSGVETDTNPANYSERLCLMPGMGAVHERPTNAVKEPPPRETDEVIINASCYSQKVNHEWLAAMAVAIESAGKPVRLRLFSGTTAFEHKGIGVFMDTVIQALPNTHIEFIQHMEYQAYIDKLAEGDFAVDCWPWGGSNVVSDYLHAGNPVVATCFTDDCGRWFNQIGAAMVNRTGAIPAWSRDGFVAKVIRMIDNTIHRELERKVYSDHTNVYDHSEAEAFARFVRNVATDPKHYPGDGPVEVGNE